MPGHGSSTAWHPGVASRIPGDIRHLATVYRPENVFTDVAAAEELADLTGLEPRRARGLPAAAARAARAPDPGQRRLLHPRRREDRGPRHQLSPDGEHNPSRLRRAGAGCASTRATMGFGVRSRRSSRRSSRFSSAPAAEGTTPAPHSAANRLRELFQLPRSQTAATAESVTASDSDVIAAWEKVRAAAAIPFERRRAALWHAQRLALFVRHGRIWGSRETIAALALDLACQRLRQRSRRARDRAAVREGGGGRARSRSCRAQDHPVVMNTKGASASGKSTLRPRQTQARRRTSACNWSEFAIISPDIWRKQLLDYDDARAGVQVRRRRSPARSCRSSTGSSIATWPARPSAAK